MPNSSIVFKIPKPINSISKRELNKFNIDLSSFSKNINIDDSQHDFIHFEIYPLNKLEEENVKKFLLLYPIIAYY